MSCVVTRSRSRSRSRSVRFNDSAEDRRVPAIPPTTTHAHGWKLTEFGKRLWPSNYVGEHVFSKYTFWLLVLLIVLILILMVGALDNPKLGISNGMVLLSELGVNRERLLYRCASFAHEYGAAFVLTGAGMVYLLTCVIDGVIATPQKDQRPLPRYCSSCRAPINKEGKYIRDPSLFVSE